jgi:hypothetical protein
MTRKPEFIKGGLLMQSYSTIPYMLPCMARNQYMMQQAVPEMMMPVQHQMPNDSQSMIGLDEYTYPQNVPGALRLIQEAVAGETEDRMFYQYLIEDATSEEDKEIIMGIRDDEIRHFSLFRQVYYQLTGQMLPPPQEVTFEKPASYCEGLKRALRG